MVVVVEFEAGHLQALSGGGVITEFEEPLHLAAGGATAHEIGGDRGAEDRVEGTDQDGFSGAGFAGDDRKAGAEFDLHVVDEGEAVDA